MDFYRDAGTVRGVNKWDSSGQKRRGVGGFGSREKVLQQQILLFTSFTLGRLFWNRSRCIIKGKG